MNTQKICIHKYKVNYNTHTQPPGYADFLRGTMALYQYCKKYGYNFYIDNTEHPIYKFFKLPESLTLSSNELPIYELFEGGYPYIDNTLKILFESGNSFTITTNAFYRKPPNDNDITNFIEFDDPELKKYMKSILIPIDEINKKIDYIFDNIYKIPRSTCYSIIHIRCGDHFIYNGNYFEEQKFIDIKNKIKNILDNNPDKKYILLTDSEHMGKLWKEQIPEILYWDNNKNHLGDLKRGIQNVEDTVTDFTIMTGAKEIISAHSGFSRCVSVIYDISYTDLYHT